MEYVILHALRPTYLNLQLPKEAAVFLGYDAGEALRFRSPGRGIAFLSRGPDVVRVISSFQAREILPVETLNDRYIGFTRPSRKLVFNLPQTVQQHLGLKVEARGPHGQKMTDDSLVWFIPAPEYYEFAAVLRAGRRWLGPGPGGFPHLYLTKSLFPLDPDLEAAERAVETLDWRPRLSTASRLPRVRRN